jgi:hypothetical protein
MCANMNITLSCEEEIVQKTRKVAQRMGKSLNGLIRDYMCSVAVPESDPSQDLQEFRKNALAHPGKSEPGFRFDRDQAHRVF